MDATLAPPLLVPRRNGLPLLLSIAHSGRNYPSWLLAEARHGRKALASLEDPLVDRLAWRAVAAGFGAVIAQTPRGAVDCNRSPEELDPAAIEEVGSAPVGPRARHGLGIVPSRTHRHGALWKRPLARERFEARLGATYTPFHDLLAAELATLRSQHGAVLLLDLHSMPPRGRGAPQVVVGNRHGTSAGDWLAEEAASIAEQAGLRSALNDPYAGGHIVERHGRPAEGIHALQVELDRSTYLARDLMSAGSGFDRASRLVEALANRLAEALRSQPTAIAAE
ncbi:MAG: N-formylglutamate amidohydrolase [Sphingomicrobium sp.]